MRRACLQFIEDRVADGRNLTPPPRWGGAAAPPKLPPERAERCSRVRIPRVPPALLRWLAVRLGQTGRFALPSVVGVSGMRPSRMLCALRCKCEFQNRSVLMPRDCRNFSRSQSCFRWSGKPCWLPSSSTFSSAASQKKSRFEMVDAERMLAAKFAAGEPPSAPPAPDEFLRPGFILAKLAGAFDVGHDGNLGNDGKICKVSFLARPLPRGEGTASARFPFPRLTIRPIPPHEFSKTRRTILLLRGEKAGMRESVVSPFDFFNHPSLPARAGFINVGQGNTPWPPHGFPRLRNSCATAPPGSPKLSLRFAAARLFPNRASGALHAVARDRKSGFFLAPN